MKSGGGDLRGRVQHRASQNTPRLFRPQSTLQGKLGLVRLSSQCCGPSKFELNHQPINLQRAPSSSATCMTHKPLKKPSLAPTPPAHSDHQAPTNLKGQLLLTDRQKSGDMPIQHEVSSLLQIFVCRMIHGPATRLRILNQLEKMAQLGPFCCGALPKVRFPIP